MELLHYEHKNIGAKLEPLMLTDRGVSEKDNCWTVAEELQYDPVFYSVRRTVNILINTIKTVQRTGT